MSRNITKTEISPNVVKLSFSDPQNLNALSVEMGEEFQDYILELKEDASLRLLVLTGEGKAFSAGGDLEMLKSKSKKSREQNILEMERFYNLFLSFLILDVPVVAAINGHAVGAGLSIALACDFRILKSGSKLGLNFLKLGLHPGMGTTYFLESIVGPSQARRILFTANLFSAEDAFKIGLADELIDADSFEERLNEISLSISDNSPYATRQLKRTLRNSKNLTLSQSLNLEAKMQAENYLHREFKEGILAAMEKRKPKY